MGEEDIIREAKDLLTDRKMIEISFSSNVVSVFLRFKKNTCEKYLNNLSEYLQDCIEDGSYTIHDLEFPEDGYTVTVLVVSCYSELYAKKAMTILNKYISIVFGDNYIGK